MIDREELLLVPAEQVEVIVGVSVDGVVVGKYLVPLLVATTPEQYSVQFIHP